MTDASEVRLSRARGEADAAKARLMNTVEEVKVRLAPGKLASDAVQSAKNKGIVAADGAVEAVKDRPGLVAGVTTAAALFLARRPLWSAVSRLWSSDEQDELETKSIRRSRPRERALENNDG
jgi:ElaB/YqjD/DUF883 family membrane-anchored ribosome-binding protein